VRRRRGHWTCASGQRGPRSGPWTGSETRAYCLGELLQEGLEVGAAEAQVLLAEVPQRALGGEVEGLRLADLVELSGGVLRFGVDRVWLRELYAAVPRSGLVGELAREVGRALRERPLTMARIFWRS